MTQRTKDWITMTRLMLIGILWATAPSAMNSYSAEWHRGNTHAHTVLCGHADSSPEAVTKLYHDHGYNFLILSEHNIFIDPKSVKLPPNKRPDFILVPGQEITGKPVGIHTTAMNIDSLIPWENKESDSRATVIKDHIHRTRNQGGVPVLNHPHGGFPASSQDVLPVKNFHMMEVYNASTKRNNLFKRRHLNLPLTAEALWDELLTKGMRVYGVGSDDAHTFMTIGPIESNAGLGWVMVRAERLDADAIVHAMENGDFCASNGVCLTTCERGPKAYEVEVDKIKTQAMLKRLPDWAGLRV